MSLSNKEAIDFTAVFTRLLLLAGYNNGTFANDLGAIFGALSNLKDSDLQPNEVKTGAGTASALTRMTHCVATGVGQVLTIPDGTYVGQMKFVCAKSGYGTNTTFVTPTHFADGTKVTLSANFHSVALMWNGTQWNVALLGGGAVS